MRARASSVIGLAVLTLLILWACGGGDGPVLTTQEYAATATSAWGEVGDRVDDLVEELNRGIEEVEARFNDDIDKRGGLKWGDGAFDPFRPQAEAFAEGMLDLLEDFLLSCARTLGEFLAQMQGLGVPAHLVANHERLVLSIEETKSELERFAGDVDSLETDFRTLGEFEAFADELNRLVDEWDLDIFDDKTDAACNDLEEVLESELGTQVEICG